MKTIVGRLEPFWETGTEGVCWALIDPVCPGYGGLAMLQNGDQLTVYDDTGDHLWDDVVNLEYKTNQVVGGTGYSGQAVFGHWVHGFQRDCGAETWAQLFFARRRASLRMTQARTDTLFHKPAKKLAPALAKLAEPARVALYRAAHYAWINWYGQRSTAADGMPEWDVSERGGQHKLLNLSEADALAVIGSPSETDVRAWQLHENAPINEDVFYRLALICGSMGRLEIIFGKNTSALMGWMNDRPLINLADLIALHDRLREIVVRSPYGFDLSKPSES